MHSSHPDEHASGPLGRAVVQEIDKVTDTLIRLQVLVTACDMGETQTIPEEQEDARYFIEHPLRMALTVYLGGSVAEQVVAQLLGQVGPTAARPSFPDAPQTATLRREAPVSPQESRLPIILVATPDRGSLQRLAMRLVGRARVASLRNAEGIRSLVKKHGADNTILVLDGCLPQFDLTAIVRELERFSTAPTIVIWGGGAGIRRALRRVAERARVAQAPFDATDRDVGDLIGSLLG